MSSEKLWVHSSILPPTQSLQCQSSRSIQGATVVCEASVSRLDREHCRPSTAPRFSPGMLPKRPPIPAAVIFSLFWVLKSWPSRKLSCCKKRFLDRIVLKFPEPIVLDCYWTAMALSSKSETCGAHLRKLEERLKFNSFWNTKGVLALVFPPLDLGLGFPPPPLRASGVKSSKEFHCRLNNISQKLHLPSRQASFSTLSRRLSGWLWKMQILKIYLQLMQSTIFAKVCAKSLSSKKHWNSCLSLDLLSMRKPLLSLRYVYLRNMFI